VWTASDLQALKSERAGNVNYIEVPVSLADEKLAPRGPSGVPSRYAELLAEANRELEKLSREELAGTNPLLRGLAGGKVRPVDEIRADKQKWQERRVLAQQAYDKLQGGAAANARED
jgi:hypothetical protein